jgi:hypothetical protein
MPIQLGNIRSNGPGRDEYQASRPVATLTPRGQIIKAQPGRSVITFARVAQNAIYARHLRQRGVAAKHVNRRRLDASKLQQMIEFAERPEVRRCAKVLGSKMSQDDGVRNAVEAIERHLVGG